MQHPPDDSHAVQLQRCVRDLLGLIALPALASGRDPRGVLEVVFGAVEALLPLDVAYGLVHGANATERVEVLRLSHEDASVRLPVSNESLSRAVAQNATTLELGGQTLHIVVTPLGWQGQDGALLFGALRADFPDATQAVLVRAAASLAASALQTARLLRESQAGSRAKDEFLAMLGHELRNPLAPIVTALHLLRLRHGAGRELEIIERQVARLVTLVDDMMDISRITRGKVELKKEVVELHAVTAGAVEAVMPLLQERGHAFRVDVSAQGLLVDVDPTRLTQVLANLLSNAANYTDPGGHIELGARREGALVVLWVKDDGIGISADLLPRIFDLFVQGRTTIHRREGGLGIGLALVKNLVQLHGGSVNAISAGPGLGSTFEVRLPARADVSVQRPPAETGVSALALSRTCERVLVVDNNVDAAVLLADLLRAVGHEVTVAHDGERALELLEKARPTVAILDIGLPGLDGYELAARVRRRLGPQTPRLIALTGYGEERDRALTARAGFSMHLVKPVHAAAVLAAIGNEPAATPGDAGH